MLGEVRAHKKNGLYYIFEFHPDSERKAWLRLDTFIWGKWRDYPKRTTTAAMLTQLTSAQQNAAIRKYRRSERSIETTPKQSSKKASRKRDRKRPSRKCNSYSFSKCPSNRCTRVKGSRKRRSYCREPRKGY